MSEQTDLLQGVDADLETTKPNHVQVWLLPTGKRITVFRGEPNIETLKRLLKAEGLL